MSYNEKHNDANLEGNRDGESHNRSWNCGAEGPTDEAAINHLRARQQRNFLTTLLLSQGVPMIAHGDELGRTQDGNNNVYCQDNELSWVDWVLTDEQKQLLAFTKTIVALRANHPVFRRRRFFAGSADHGGESNLGDIFCLKASGDLKRVIPPLLTGSERAQQAARLEQEANLQAQIKEDQRQNRALVLRYPDPAAHYRARAELLEQQDGLIAAVRVRAAELDRQRLSLAAKLEFYRQQPDQAPAELRQLEQENTRQRAFQSAQLEAQQRERQRIEQRFDEELARLRQLWTQEAR